MEKTTWSDRRIRLRELEKEYPVLGDILQVYKVLNTFTFSQRSEKKHEEAFLWLEDKLKEMTRKK